MKKLRDTLQFIIFIFMPFFLTSQSTAKTQKESEGTCTTLMTFNIRYGTAQDGENDWQNRKEQVFDLIKKYNPDILGLQEALKFQIDEILSATAVYQKTGVGRDDGDSLGEFSALLYRSEQFDLKQAKTFWFSDTPDIAGSKSWGNSIPRICTWAQFFDKQNSVFFVVYNLHLDHQSQISREKSLAFLSSIISKQDTNYPYIVMGDFNAGETNPALKYLLGSTESDGKKSSHLNMIDTFRVIYPEDKETGTFNGFEGIKTGEKIDHIFVSKNISVKGAKIIYDNVNGRYPSDHFPVLAKVLIMDKDL